MYIGIFVYYSYRKFYEEQDNLIQIYKDACKCDDEKLPIGINQNLKKVNLAAKLSFTLNLILFSAKLVAAVLSGSFSILSSVVDSAVDLISGIVIWYTNRAIKLTNIYNYPVGEGNFIYTLNFNDYKKPLKYDK